MLHLRSTLEGLTDSVLTGITTVAGHGKTSMTEITTTYSPATGVTTYALAQAPRTDVRNVVAAVANNCYKYCSTAVMFEQNSLDRIIFNNLSLLN